LKLSHEDLDQTSATSVYLCLPQAQFFQESLLERFSEVSEKGICSESQSPDFYLQRTVADIAR
jgi:hypothetical protein